MTCGPVLIQWLPSGLVAYGSVLLASVPPSSMYIRPTLPTGGVAWDSQACTQASAALSAHIGSGPGVAGASGMQVNPLVPWRNVRMLPSDCMAMMVAWRPTPGGAARMALAMSPASDEWLELPACATGVANSAAARTSGAIEAGMRSLPQMTARPARVSRAHPVP